jgi:two-component system, NarL family, response regulator DevR
MQCVVRKDSDMAEDVGRCGLAVLLVDQAILVRQRIRAILEDAIGGCVVYEAGSIAEAQGLFVSADPDLVMLDLDLPDGNGLKVASFVKQTREDCVVVVLSNYSDLEIRQYCQALGVDHFFEKSTEFEQAIETIGGLVTGLTARETLCRKRDGCTTQ